jgi:hypothetical protein
LRTFGRIRPLSYIIAPALAGGTPSDSISLEETFLLLLLVIPMGYFAVCWLLALIAAA